MEYKRKSDITEAIRAQITTKPNQAVKAMLRIYEYQTADEKAQGETTHDNGVGFMSRDAELLTSFSKQYLRSSYLSNRQMTVLYKVIGKYAGQLTRLAFDKGMYKKQNGYYVAVSA